MIDVYVKFVKTTPLASIPRQGSAEAAGWDLCAAESVYIPKGATRAVDLGFRVEFPAGWEIQVRSRSGLALKHSVVVANSPGTVDSDFRGSMKVLLRNEGDEAFQVNVGDRIAQAVVKRVPTVKWVEVEEISDTQRGEGGFGSTGIKTE